MSVFADSGFDKDSRTCSKGVSPGLGTTKHQICCMLFIISLSCGHTNLQSNNTARQNTVSFSFNIWWEEGVVVDGRFYCLASMVCNNYLSTLRFTSVVVVVKSSSRLLTRSCGGISEMSMHLANQLTIPKGWRPCFLVTKVSIFITVEQESAKAHTDTVGRESANQ